MERSIKTTCPYCGTGCGIVARVDDAGQVAIRGDEEHPANHGRLCSKGAALGETLSLEDRLLHPEIGGRRATWDEALDAAAQGFARIVREHGPDAVAFYVSGQLLTEDYYVANKLMKGYIGSANLDTNSRLCMASSVAGHKRAFGADTVPGCYQDLELAELVVFAGSNAAWCHPVLFQRVAQAKRANPALKVVVIDPRRTATCDIADLHLPLASGSDAVLWNGLLDYLRRRGVLDFDFLEQHTEGYAEALRAARESAPSVPAVAAACGLREEDVARFYQMFADTGRVVSVYSQGINQSSSGTDKVNAIINCHLATGRIGRPGMGPFSVTGQPNAMGGREVGALANQLAAHLDFNDPAHAGLVERFWQAPRLVRTPGLKAVDLFHEIGQGRIKAVWIMATNPVVSLPDADKAREALARCELVVVSDCVRDTDTAALAHVLLPALTWGEKDGTVTNSERRISRQRAFLPAPGEAKPDWWIVCEVAKRMGFADAFAYTGPAAIFAEHAALSGFENQGARDFDLSGLSTLSEAGYEALAPVQWPVTPERPQGTARLFAGGGFFTPNRKARLLPVTPRPPHNPAGGEYPFVLNTGRVRDHWHTMTRTGKSARLSAHIAEPYAELHPADAASLGIAEGALVRLTSPWGGMLARARLSAGQRRGSVFAPMHWNDRYASRGRVGALVNPVTDPFSGQPESKHTPVRIEPCAAAWYGFLLVRRPVADAADYWARVRDGGVWRYELAGLALPGDWSAWARALLGVTPDDNDWVEYRDAAAGYYRAGLLRNGRLEGCVYTAPTPDLPARAWLAGLFAKDALEPAERIGLLTGRPPAEQCDGGRIVCACFGVGEKRIAEAIRHGNLSTAEAVGAVLKAGTNCGSCLPEIRSLLGQTAHHRSL